MAEDLAPLVYRVALGEQRAFEALYRQTSPRLFSLALLLLKRRDLAEEALQDAFVSVWHGAPSYRPELGTVSTWLNVILRRRCIDRLRREPRAGLPLSEEDWAQLPVNDPSPLQALLSDSDAQLLARCLEQLEGRQRESVALAFFHGLSHSELAQQLTAPLGTVKAWVRRGLERLRGCLHHEI